MKVVQKVAIEKDGKFLILLRSDVSQRFSGCWDFPGGKLDACDDCLIAGLKREVLEETNLVVDELRILRDFLFNDLNGGNYNFRIYHTKSFSGDFKLNEEHSDYKWIRIDEFKNFKLALCTHTFQGLTRVQGST